MSLRELSPLTHSAYRSSAWNLNPVDLTVNLKIFSSVHMLS